jgi:tol-pal system protein YbgF
MYKYKLGFLGYLLSSSLCLVVLITPVSAEVNPQSIVQIFQRLEILEKRSRELTGENEVLKHQIEQLKKVQKQGFLNIDEQIDEMRQSIKQDVSAQNPSTAKPEKIETPVTATKPDTTKATTPVSAKKPLPIVKTDGVKTVPATKEEETHAATSTGKTRAPTAYEKETYQAAFNTMTASPTAATRAFKEYIKLQPNSPLAANAQYWIGEIMYSHNNYKGAVQEFIKVLQKYKTSNKAPDAAIKLGYSFYALKNWEYARRTFEDVLKYFPDNKTAVSLATKRLEKMKKAGN